MRAQNIVTSILVLVLAAAEARGAGVVFDYYYLYGGMRIAHGEFTFRDALLGQTIHYADLDSFQLKFYSPEGSGTYDLTYVRTGTFSEYLYFGFNTSANTFVGTNINGFTTYMAAIMPGYVDGFWLGIERSGNHLAITDYSSGTTPYNIGSSSIRALPSLSIQSAGTNCLISWPDISSTAGFILQHATDLTPTNWSNVEVSPSVTNGRKQVIVSPAAGQHFYRLAGP